MSYYVYLDVECTYCSTTTGLIRVQLAELDRRGYFVVPQGDICLPDHWSRQACTGNPLCPACRDRDPHPF
jgi:hypothetical protein